jgi:altronate dehydratase small subunit
MSSQVALLRLHPADNVLIAVRALHSGEELRFEDMSLAIACEVPLGHKVAARAIEAGAKIVKWGAPIGSATQAIGVGEHVHLHNMQSDYLPTYTLDEEHRFINAQS